MAQKWVSFEEVKSRVHMTDVLTHYGLMQGTQEKPSKYGTELRLHCPFHEDSIPSLSINAETGKFHTLLLDSGVLCSTMVREAHLLIEGH